MASIECPKPQPSKHVVNANRQFPDALACRMIDLVGDRRGGSKHDELAHSLHADRIDHDVRLVDQTHIYVADVGKIIIEVAGETRIDFRFLPERRTEYGLSEHSPGEHRYLSPARWSADGKGSAGAAINHGRIHRSDISRCESRQDARKLNSCSEASRSWGRRTPLQCFLIR